MIANDDSRPLKIMMLAPNPFFVDRGFSVRVYEEARALRDLGHDVTIVAYHCGRDLDGFRIYRSWPVPWYGEEATGGSLHRLYIDLLLLARAMRAVRLERPDILHGHIHEGAMVGLFSRLLWKAPVVLDAQEGMVRALEDKRFFRGLKRPLRPVFRMIEKWINHRVNLLFTSTENMEEDLLRDFRVPRERIVRTMDGVNADDLSPRPADRQLARQIGLPHDKRIIVFLGLLEPHQGVDCLVEAAQLTLGRRDDHHFLVMGYPNVQAYRERVTKLGLDRHFTFTGRIDYGRAADYLALGDIAVSPKLIASEGNGKLYNYMAMALPIVAFERPADREILGESAVFCRVGDSHDLARGLLEALDDPQRCGQLGEAARKRVERQFSWTAVARKLEEHYRSLVESNGE